jgi:prepilin-type N-terminal cleavage/methylation domain-containing protein
MRMRSRIHSHAGPTQRSGEAGFTLIEALAAIAILSFGLVAVSNLFIVSSVSNMTAHRQTATAMQAAEVAERLKAIIFDDLTNNIGGDLDDDAGTIDDCDDDAVDCVVAGNYNASREVDNVGTVKTRWSIVRPGAGGPDTIFITVRSEVIGVLGSQRTRSQFTTFRTCTTTGCP